jgi:hypothetical protein
VSELIVEGVVQTEGVAVLVEKTVDVYERVEVVENDGSVVSVGDTLTVTVPRTEREPVVELVLVLEAL